MSNNGKNLIFLNDLKSDFVYKDDEPSVAKQKSNTIWKYMSLEHALDLVENQWIWLADPKEWNDPYERLFVEASYKHEGEEKDKEFYELLDKRKLYCTCFTSGFQNDAQWKMYCGNDIAVMIGFDVLKLFEALGRCPQKLYIGKAEYIGGGWNQIRNVGKLSAELTDAERRQTILRWMLRKRINFEYEKEIRLMCLQKQRSDRSETKGIHVRVHYLRNCITRIRLQPNLGNRTVMALRDVFLRIFQQGAMSAISSDASVAINKSRLFSQVKKDYSINI